MRPYEKAFRKVSDLIGERGLKISRLDLGGGLGVVYNPTSDNPPNVEEYAKLIQEVYGSMDLEIEVEPGRFIVADAGILVSSVLYKKTGENRNFLVIDAAMNDLIRPAMYSSYHEIKPILEPRNPTTSPYDVVGPVCESSDTFAENRQLPELQAWDLLAFMTAGAYTTVMASEYNTRPMVSEIMVRENKWAFIRKSPSIEEILSTDIIPTW